MPKPYQFSTEQELIEHFRTHQMAAAASAFFAQRSKTVADVVKTGVTGNTFRAFRKLPVRPSLTFRNWASDYINNTIDFLLSITDSQRYEQYVHEATNDLCLEWSRITGSDMGYGRGAKLFNLVLKKLACLCSLSEAQRSTLIGLQHIPLDSYTIIGLRTIFPYLAIPNNATMKFIETPEQYADFQRRIRTIAKKAGVPSIYYDVLAWDMGHKS